jgi:hypothetical protein
MSSLTVHGATFFQVFAGDWMSASFNRRVAGVLDDNILTIGRNYVGGCPQFWKVPDWAQEGHAVYLTHLIETQWEIGPQQLPQECFTTLMALKAGQSCVYKEGAQAFALLAFTHPNVEYFDLLSMIKNGKSFDDAFQKTYGIPVSQFYKQFDDFLYTCPGYSLPTLGLSIKCFGRMTNESLPPDLQGQENVYGFEVSGIDLTAHASELDQIIKAPKDATLAVDGNRLFVSIDSSTPKDRYVVSISIDGQSAGTSFEWKK